MFFGKFPKIFDEPNIFWDFRRTRSWANYDGGKMFEVRGQGGNFEAVTLDEMNTAIRNRLTAQSS
jgi:hypothetical protein